MTVRWEVACALIRPPSARPKQASSSPMPPKATTVSSSMEIEAQGRSRRKQVRRDYHAMNSGGLDSPEKQPAQPPKRKKASKAKGTQAEAHGSGAAPEVTPPAAGRTRKKSGKRQAAEESDEAPPPAPKKRRRGSKVG
mgnify:CR=1 FL=1